jgi:transcription initiation factor TFIID TATA-box-binding protein
MEPDLDIVNIVGSGEIDAEIDLSVLIDDLPLDGSYIKGSGLYFEFCDDGPTIVVVRTGKYIISGAKSKDDLDDTRSKVLHLFAELGVTEGDNDLSFSVKNMVFTHDSGSDVNLPALAVHAGLEKVEYEPEQFPGLIFRPQSPNSVALIFATGKIVITGVTNRLAAEDTIESVLDLLGEVRE